MRALALACLAVASSACGEFDIGTYVASCNVPTRSICIDYGKGYTPSSAMTDCSVQQSGDYSATPCPLEGRVCYRVFQNHPRRLDETRYGVTVYTDDPTYCAVPL